MSDIRFEVKDYYDLLNLHKALLEAKFHRNPDNELIPASPIIARLHNEIVDLLAKHDFEKKGKQDWTSWRQIKNRSDYMEKAIDNAVFYDTCKSDSEWDKLGFEEKSERAKNFLAPFNVTENEIGAFINEVTERLRQSKKS